MDIFYFIDTEGDKHVIYADSMKSIQKLLEIMQNKVYIARCNICRSMVINKSKKCFICSALLPNS